MAKESLWSKTFGKRKPFTRQQEEPVGREIEPRSLRRLL